MELKKCPFCGSDVEIETSMIERGWWCGTAICIGRYSGKCSVQMIVGADTEENALARIVEAWNTREEN